MVVHVRDAPPLVRERVALSVDEPAPAAVLAIVLRARRERDADAADRAAGKVREPHGVIGAGGDVGGSVETRIGVARDGAARRNPPDRVAAEVAARLVGEPQGSIGTAAMRNGPAMLIFGSVKFETTPLVVIRPIEPRPALSMNQSAPSEPAAIPCGPVIIGSR